MGYNTTFTGRVTVTPALNPHETRYLEQFVDGGYHGGGLAPDVVVAVGRPEPFPGHPGGRCKWAPSEDGSAIGWNEEEKFYDADRWMAYLIDTFLKPGATVARELADPVPARVYPEEFTHFTFDHIVNGAIEAEGEWPDDRWRLEVRDNVVYVIHYKVEPNHDEFDPADPGDWGDDQWAQFAARTRHNVAFVVREGQLHEIDPAQGIVFDPVQPAA